MSIEFCSIKSIFVLEYHFQSANFRGQYNIHWFKNQRKVPFKKGFFPFFANIAENKARSHGMKLCTSIKLVSQECIHIFLTYSWGTTIHFIHSSGKLVLPIFGFCSFLGNNFDFLWLELFREIVKFYLNQQWTNMKSL